jgi:predicted oxidoreductase
VQNGGGAAWVCLGRVDVPRFHLLWARGPGTELVSFFHTKI